MPNLDDILGAQQDQIAEGRLELSQLTRNVPDLQECKTPFEVFCRIYEIGGENPVRDVLYLTRLKLMGVGSSRSGG